MSINFYNQQCYEDLLDFRFPFRVFLDPVRGHESWVAQLIGTTINARGSSGHLAIVALRRAVIIQLGLNPEQAVREEAKAKGAA